MRWEINAAGERDTAYDVGGTRAGRTVKGDRLASEADKLHPRVEVRCAGGSWKHGMDGVLLMLVVVVQSGLGL